jgi:hypothetical protein
VIVDLRSVDQVAIGQEVRYFAKSSTEGIWAACVQKPGLGSQGWPFCVLDAGKSRYILCLRKREECVSL